MQQPVERSPQMKTDIILKIILTILLFGAITNCVHASIITVDDESGKNYTSIQAAIDAATIGDTISIYPGNYTENITISKQLVIEGQSGNSEDVIINTAGAINTLEITADNVTIKSISANDNIVGNPSTGLKITESDNCIIENCAFKRNLYNQLYNYNSYNTKIRKCYFLGTAGASEGTCVNIDAPGTSKIVYNVTVENSTLWGTSNNLKLDFSNGNTIKDCYIQNGINFWGGSSNILYNNVFAPQTDKSFHFEAATGNIIYNNIFLFNSSQINYNGVCTNNSFSLSSKQSGSGIVGGTQVGGNVWATEKFTDIDGDNFSDSTYTVISGISAADLFPVMMPVSTAATGSTLSPAWIGAYSTSLTWNICNDTTFSKYVLWRGYSNTNKSNYKVFETSTRGTVSYTDNDPNLFPGRRNYYILETQYSNGTSYYSSVECWSIHHTKKHYWIEGDSISAYNYAYGTGWARRIQDEFLAPLGWTQKNTAVSGKVVNTSMSTLQTFSQSNDGEIFMDAIGINDFYGQDPDRDSNDTYADVYNQTKYVATRGSTVYWMLLMPTNNENMFQKNFNWRAIAVHDPNVTIVNTFDSIDSIIENGNFDSYNFTNEASGSVHPNDNGSELIARKVFLLMCIDGKIANETYHPQGTNTSKPLITGRQPQYSKIVYDGNTTIFNATLPVAADCAWYVNGVFLNLDFNTTTPDLPLAVRNNQYTVSMRAMNPENHSAYHEYYWKENPGTTAQEIGTFFNRLMNTFYRFFFQRLTMRAV